MAAERHYLTGLDLRGRRVVLVGGGGVAARRLPRLLAAGAEVELISPEVTPAVQALAESGGITWTQRGYRDGDLAGAWYAISAATEADTNEADTNEAVVAEATARRVFCVRADAGELGSAVTPATGTHGGMVLGVLAPTARCRPSGSCAPRWPGSATTRPPRTSDHPRSS
jgi:uroporphyrin-III C-methyltransferase/precorrin-2 dehydrogenase/sirohydrochlorin ferrochelatase